MCRVRTRANNFIPCNRDTKPLMSLFLTRYRSENVCNVTTRTIEITPAPSRHTGQTVVWLHGPQRRTENDEKRNSMALRLYGVCAVSALGHERGATADRSSYYAAATHSNFSPTRRCHLFSSVYAKALDLLPRPNSWRCMHVYAIPRSCVERVYVYVCVCFVVEV